MNETTSCAEQDALIDFLYGEADANARARMDAHLRSCEPCADEIRELKSVRGKLEAWAPPEAELDFRVVSDAPSVPASGSFWGRFRHRAAWGLAAAAVLVLAAGAAITERELEITWGETVLRLGWIHARADDATQRGVEPAAPSDRATVAAAQQQLEPPRTTPVTAAADDEALWQFVLQLLRDEAPLAGQRQAYLKELRRELSDFQGTGVEPSRRQVLDALTRVSTGR